MGHPQPVALTLVLACSTPEQRATPMPTPDAAVAVKPATDCAGRVRSLVAGDLSAGLGLPAGCRLGSIEPVLGSRSDAGSGSLSFHVRPWLAFDRGNVRVWLESERDDHVLRIDIGGLSTAETATTIETRLGKPAQQLRSEVNPGTREWIYPDRGLTLSIAGSSTDPALRAIAAFASTTLDDYNGRLGGTTEPVRRRP